jgi:hypothetical protein
MLSLTIHSCLNMTQENIVKCNNKPPTVDQIFCKKIPTNKINLRICEASGTEVHNKLFNARLKKILIINM